MSYRTATDDMISSLEEIERENEWTRSTRPRLGDGPTDTIADFTDDQFIPSELQLSQYSPVVMSPDVVVSQTQNMMANLPRDLRETVQNQFAGYSSPVIPETQEVNPESQLTPNLVADESYENSDDDGTYDDDMTVAPSTQYTQLTPHTGSHITIDDDDYVGTGSQSFATQTDGPETEAIYGSSQRSRRYSQTFRRGSQTRSGNRAALYIGGSISQDANYVHDDCYEYFRPREGIPKPSYSTYPAEKRKADAQTRSKELPLLRKKACEAYCRLRNLKESHDTALFIARRQFFREARGLFVKTKFNGFMNKEFIDSADKFIKGFTKMSYDPVAKVYVSRYYAPAHRFPWW